ncbi:MAG: fibronectin-binding domain-containing protein, partial [Euryarchaeota archaeon]|nr:fibronectin-binding domain-containing protein [Euryarchaeota archaeon]
MREQASSFDVARIVRELSKMIGARARKAYQPHYEQVVIRLNPKGSPSSDLVIVSGRRLYLSQRDRPMPSQPSQFAMVLRKHLNNSRLIEVEQLGFDRIISLTFEHGSGKLKLIIELFRDGNVLLLDNEDVIIQPLTHANYASRTLKRGVKYVSPPPAIDPREIDREKLNQLLDGSNDDLIRTLAARGNLGRIYGSAICASAELDEKLNAKELDDNQREKLDSSIKKLLNELAENQNSRMWFSNNETLKLWNNSIDTSDKDSAAEGITEIAPIDLRYLEYDLSIEIPSLCYGYDSVFGPHDASAFIRREEEKLVSIGQDEGEKKAKLERRADQQRNAIGRFLSQAAISQELGKAMQENWTHLEHIMKEFNEQISKLTWQEVAEKSREVPWIDRLNPKKGTFVAFLPDEEGEPGSSVTLHANKSVHQNAQRYFQEARTLKDKSKGAEKALMDTENSKSRQEKKRAKDVAAGRVKGIQRSKKFWFEKYRWAILEGGHILVGGRDARGNDTIVRKHLNSNDIYVHADLHGAPSCSLKLKDGFIPLTGITNLPEGVVSLQIAQNLGEGVEDARDLNEKILAQAAQIAVCWSRAWGSGGAAATAFHVRPSQVSKQTESGESLGRGSFVVRGKRTWHRDLPLELGMGIGVINGVPLPICGTIETISDMFEKWIKISPGREKKESIANKISKASGLTQDDVLASLPPGGC